MLPFGDQFPLGYEPVFHIMAISGPVVFIVQIGTVRDFLRGGSHNRRGLILPCIQSFGGKWSGRTLLGFGCRLLFH